MKIIERFWVWLGEPARIENGHVVAWWIAGLIVGTLVGVNFHAQ